MKSALKAGPGVAFSPGGYAITILAQPEIGYSFIFGEDSAFHLDLAGGLLFNMPIAESPKLGFELSTIGWLVHRTIPIIRVGLGVAFLDWRKNMCAKQSCAHLDLMFLMLRPLVKLIPITG